MEYTYKYQDFNKINYWLEQWCYFIEKFNQHKLHSNFHFVIYEQLTDPNYLKRLLKKIKFNNIDNLNFNYFKNFNRQEIEIKYSKDIYENAKDIYLSILNSN